jgi:hypothetical protein
MKTPQITLALTLLVATLLITTPARAQRVPRPPLTLTQQLARFDGSWGAHGVGLRLDVQAHTAEISMRTYRWCGPQVRPPYDRLTGNIITPGLDVVITINAVQGDTAIGTVRGTTDVHGLPRGSYVGLTLLPHGRMYLDDVHFVLGRVVCNARYFEHHPAAYQRWWTCGA